MSSLLMISVTALLSLNLAASNTLHTLSLQTFFFSELHFEFTVHLFTTCLSHPGDLHMYSIYTHPEALCTGLEREPPRRGNRRRKELSR